MMLPCRATDTAMPHATHPIAAPRLALWIFTALATLLALTRMPSLTPAALPDASWAVFFLGGLYLARGAIGTLAPLTGLAVLLGLAALVDALAIGALHVGANCFTSGYAFLLPAYAALWVAGAWAARYGIRADATTALRCITALLLGSATTFLLSNLGFYWFGGNSAGLPAALFAERVIGYYPGYLYSAAAWSAAALALHAVLTRWQPISIDH